jgi:hypothetical protein
LLQLLEKDSARLERRQLLLLFGSQSRQMLLLVRLERWMALHLLKPHCLLERRQQVAGAALWRLV